MKTGFVLPYGDARRAADWAYRAEQVGWDGFFVWEPVWGIDAWVCLTAAAMRTERIRLGTMLTPLSRMRPWKLASETATLDNLSDGRVILSLGMGAVDTGFDAFGEEIDRKARAERLDEGLDILLGLWKGQPFTYTGKHYQVKECTFMPPPPPVQQPHIPVWMVGAWPSQKSMRRVLRCDGLLPQVIKDGKAMAASPDEVRQMRDFVLENRIASASFAGSPFDIIVEGQTPGDDPAWAAKILQPWAEAGVTWWIEALWDMPTEAVLGRLEQGPPKIDI